MTKTVVIAFDEHKVSRDEAIEYMEKVVNVGKEAVLLSKHSSGKFGLSDLHFMINVSIDNTNFLYNFNPVSEEKFFEKLTNGILQWNMSRIKYIN